MKVDITKIEGYENMSAEEKIKALTETDFDVETDNSELIKLKNALNKASSEAAEYKKQIRAKLSEDEAKEAERLEKEKAVQEELEELRRSKKMSEYVTNFIGIGYDKETAEKTATAMLDGDMTTVFQLAGAREEAHKKELEAAKLNGQPGLVGGKTLSVTETDKMSDAEYYDYMRKKEKES